MNLLLTTTLLSKMKVTNKLAQKQINRDNMTKK